MKWNAIITKIQYEKSLNRATELSHALPGTDEKDELTLLLIMIKDYEQRHTEMAEPGSRKLKIISGNHGAGAADQLHLSLF